MIGESSLDGIFTIYGGAKLASSLAGV